MMVCMLQLLDKEGDEVMGELLRKDVEQMIDKLEAECVGIERYLVIINDRDTVEVHTEGVKSYQSKSVRSIYYWIKNDDACRKKGLESS